MNTKAKPFDDVRVRRAINLAIHRQEFNDTLRQGIHLLGTPFPPGSWFSRSLAEAAQLRGFRELDGEKHPDDIAEARKLLADAGVTPGTKLELSAINQADSPRIAAILADQLNRYLGLDVTLRVMEPAAALSAYFAGDVQFTVQESFYNLSDPDAVYRRYTPGLLGVVTTGGETDTSKQFVVAGIQDLFQRQSREQDRSTRAALNRQAEDILLNEDNAYVGIMWTMRGVPIHDKIKGYFVHPSAYGMHLKHEAEWCDPAC